MKIYVSTIIEKNNKYLMIQENKESCKGKWNFPAGHVEENEYIIDAAIREVKEETNEDITLLNVINIYNNMFEGEFSIGIIFSGKLIKENDINFDKNEIRNCKWFTYDEIINMKDELRDKDYMINPLKNYIKGYVSPLDLIVNR